MHWIRTREPHCDPLSASLREPGNQNRLPGCLVVAQLHQQARRDSIRSVTIVALGVSTDSSVIFIIRTTVTPVPMNIVL